MEGDEEIYSALQMWAVASIYCKEEKAYVVLEMWRAGSGRTG